MARLSQPARVPHVYYQRSGDAYCDTWTGRDKAVYGVVDQQYHFFMSPSKLPCPEDPITTREASSSPQATLSLLDAISMMLGIVIGVGILQTAPTVAQNVSGASMLYLCWLLGVIVSLCGALCSAELAYAARLPADISSTRLPGDPSDLLPCVQCHGVKCPCLCHPATTWGGILVTMCFARGRRRCHVTENTRRRAKIERLAPGTQVSFISRGSKYSSNPSHRLRA